jgi:hypothetical protein
VFQTNPLYKAYPAVAALPMPASVALVPVLNRAIVRAGAAAGVPVFDAGAAARGLQFLEDGYHPSYAMASAEATAFKRWVAATLQAHCHLSD